MPTALLLFLATIPIALSAWTSSASILAEVAFEENRGQLAPSVHFATRAKGFGVVAYDGSPAIRVRVGGKVVELRILFEAGDPTVVPTGEALLPGQLHYFRGASSDQWKTRIRRYARIRYADVYPGIDAVLHERDGEVELDFEVAPGADSDPIALAFAGAERVQLESDGKLTLFLGEERFQFSAPEVYQRRGTAREYKAAAYELERAEGMRVEFEVAEYDSSRELVIDPVFLGFSTRIGGAGSDTVRDVATDAAGNIYLTGSTSSADFAGLSPAPVGDDVFVAKIDATTQDLVYIAFFGGDGFEQAWAVEADVGGNAYVAGYTTSTVFPTLGGFDSSVDNTDAFFLKLDPSGSLLYGTVYGGADLDGEFNGGIGVHAASGRVYVGSRTDTTNLPTLNAFSANCPNAPCSFVVGFDPAQTGASSLVYASYVTGPNVLAQNEDGGVLDLDVDSNEKIYAFGFVNPGSSVVLAGQGFQDATGDIANNDHYLVKLDPSLLGVSQRTYSTFIGGTGDETERGRLVALDSGIVYVGSKTDSTAATFPILNALQPVNAGGEDGYVIKVDTTLSGVASQLWGTFLGSLFDEEINTVAVDVAGNAWIAATVSLNGSASFPQVLPLPGSPAFGIDDSAAVAQIASDGSALLFSSSTVAGGAPLEQGIAILPNGRVVVAGSRSNANFPLKGGLPLYPVGGSEIALVGLDPGPDRGLVLEMGDTMDPAVTGQSFAFQYLIRNQGIAAAANATLTTDFPAGLTATLASGGCSLPGTSAVCSSFEDIPRGGNSPIYIVASSATDGSHTVNGSVTSDLIDPSPVDDNDSETIATDATGMFPASLTLSDFDMIAASSDIGGFVLDTRDGVLATPNGSSGEVLNLMKNDAPLPFQIESLLGQGEVAFGFVDNAIWTPGSGDGSDLFGRDFNAVADRVFAIVDSRGAVELRTGAAFDAGRVIDTGFVPLGRPGLLSLSLSPTNAEVVFDGVVVAAGDPFTADFRDAAPANVGNDFVLSVGFGTEDRGAAVISVPEPSLGWMLLIGVPGLIGLSRRRR